MPDRRNFIKLASAGLLSVGAGVRAFAQMASNAVTSFVQESAPNAETIYNGKKCLYFGGTGYHGLQNHPELIKAAQQALVQFGTHSGTSRYPYGTTSLYIEVEKKAAEFFGTEDAAYVCSGYLQNMAAFQAMAQLRMFDVILLDETAHYSVFDFAWALRKPVFTFAHADPEDLARQLKANVKAGEKPLVMSDGIFPTFGLLAPVPEYLKIVEQYDGLIWLDDAHAVGVLGPHGRGTFDHYGLKSERLYFGGTFSKAFGAHGGVIPGKAELVRTIRNGHIMNGASAGPSATAAAALKGMELIAAHPEWREKLAKNARQLKSGLKEMGFEMNDGPVPVAAWRLKSGQEMDRVHSELLKRGILIQRSRYVGAGPDGALRAVVFSTHTPEQIGRLLSELKTLV
ncbi:MAG TPA: pyridoxal phosphate-dependent aminotransferase family protein [Terriglobales bacterium]|nr:pyridoxal phosphate-dependent aminotransferase family protein [Terriglobales bacterium]